MFETYAVKSAAPVAASVASCFNVALQTAPLCPSKVPIQSPVSPFRNMGLPSVQNENQITMLLLLFCFVIYTIERNMQYIVSSSCV